MGKKSAKAPAKAPAAKAVAATSDTAATSGVAGSSSNIGTDYLSRLSEEDQQLELRRREEREKKALAAKKKEEEDRQRREWKESQAKATQLKAERQAKKDNKETTELLQRARAEGVLEAVEYEDGCCYVELAKNTWKMVECPYWCRHCEASLNLSVLGSHLSGNQHKKKLAWVETPGTSAAPATVAAHAAQASASKVLAAAPPAQVQSSAAARMGSPLEPWQQQDSSGYIRCLACNKMCDGIHEQSAEHQRRVESYMWQIEVGSRDYPEPPQAWLAWVKDASSGDARYLKCLMCEKWVQDLEGGDANGYVGNHGDRGVNNQKDHAKKLNNLAAWLPTLRAEKAKWHTPQPTRRTAEVAQCRTAATAGATPTCASWATTAGAGGAAAATVAAPTVWACTAGSPAPASVPTPAWGSAVAAVQVPRPLPAGWKEQLDPKTQEIYYYKGSVVQWDFPQEEEEEC